MEISCIVLAGGKSSRLGHNKITENIGGKMLVERVLDVLSLFESQTILVTSPHTSLPDLAKYPQTKIVKDIYPGKGSLGGIYSGLSFSKTFYNLLVACDMPFLNFNLLQYMLDIAPGYDLVAYREGERFEPLHAVYSKNCLPPLESLLKQDNVRIIELLRYIKARYLSLNEMEGFDPRHLSFFNINTPEELQKANEIAGQVLIRD
jgi:molybdenum cofactor guanylyltransferase